ncbi:hypothetical protein O5D80_003732 [Batrachochytrium dendrobatidis]|nr:hypothetical protein O5D80_003732 [Batrachochytrium dendrobatidis]
MSSLSITRTKSLSNHSVTAPSKQQLLQRVYASISKTIKKTMLSNKLSWTLANKPSQSVLPKSKVGSKHSDDLTTLSSASESPFIGLLDSSLLDSPRSSTTGDTISKSHSWLESPSFLAPLAVHILSKSSSQTLSVLDTATLSAFDLRSYATQDISADDSSDLLDIIDQTGAVSSSVQLQSLPAELICNIAMRAGFFSALRLCQTSKYFNLLLSCPSSWGLYKHLSSDHIQNTVTVVTKIHTFDHLIFGDWQPGHISHNDSATSNEDEREVYFVHKTFLEQFDFLGGISFSMHPGGLATANFFEHREQLSCYLEDMRQGVQSGRIPPPLIPEMTLPPTPQPSLASTPREDTTDQSRTQALLINTIVQTAFPSASSHHVSPVGGARLQHKCPSCEAYDTQTVHKSIFVFDQVPRHPTWARDGLTYTYAFKDCKRTLRITVKPSVNRICNDNLPMVTFNAIAINNIDLSPLLYALFLKLVHKM